MLRARNSRAVLSWWVTWLVVSSGGCWFVTTKHEGKVLRKRIVALERRLEELHEREETVRKSIRQAREEQKKLAELMERARKVFLRNSADVGARVEMLMEKMGSVLGRLEDTGQDLRALQKRHAELKSEVLKLQTALAALRTQFQALVRQLASRPKEPQTPDELWKAGRQAFQKGDYVTAARYLRRLTGMAPGHPQAEEAAFLAAEAYFRQGKFAAAEFLYKKYLRRYPNGRHAARAWLRRARCHYELKYCTSALGILREMLRRIRRGQEAEEARRLAARIRRQRRNIRYCER